MPNNTLTRLEEAPEGDDYELSKDERLALIAIVRAAQEVEQARSLTVLHQKIEALRSALAAVEE